MTGVFPVYNIKFKIGTNGRSSVEGDMATIADMETFSMSVDGTVQTWTSMTTDGWQRSLMTGKSFSVSLKGKRNVGDKGNDYIANTTFADGLNCSSRAIVEFPDGSRLEFDCVINVTNNAGGDSTDVAPLEFDLQGDGKPVYTRALSSLAITKPATKTQYIIGDTLDIGGLEVSGTYSDGTKEVFAITKDNISGFDSSKPIEKQTLTISVANKKVTYDIKIIDQLLSIAITKSATKTQYNVGESLNIEGLEVTGTYKSGTTKKETVTTSNISGFDSSKANDKLTLTITINSKTTTYTVKVVAPQQ